MFTPPPSPQPLKTIPEEDIDYFSAEPVPSPAKRAAGRRTRWAVLLVPLVIILVTAAARYLVWPNNASMLSTLPPVNLMPLAHPHSHPFHKRHPNPDPATSSSASTIAFPSGSGSATPTTSSSPTETAQSLPTIPASAPALPTPFPQPLDAISQNFSSNSCFNFFMNMTTTEPFRSCRPFGMLLQSSTAFISQSQDNVTALNDIVWGTCNTTISSDQCTSNMAWFASTLQSACSQDLNDRNGMAVSTLIGLQSYALMRQAGCLADPVTNTYCYVEAVHNSNPSDLYFYQLPLGMALPNNTTPTCSSCTKSLLSMYVTDAGTLTGLVETYEAAAEQAEAKCGSGYAAIKTSSSSSNGSAPRWGIGPWWVSLAAAAVGAIAIFI